MAIAKLPTAKTVEEIESTIPDNIETINKPKTTTPWVNSVAGYEEDPSIFSVSGNPWPSNYYQQLKELGDIGDSIDVLVDAAYQQYSKINNFVLKLQGSLDYNTDETTKETTISGTAVIIDTLVPNKGDLFVAERGVTRVGLFVVTGTERLSAFNNSGYTIKFLMIEESNLGSSGVRLSNLESKVVSNFYYNENYLYLGTKPILTGEEVATYYNREATAKLLTEDYLREFYSPTTSTVVLDLNENLIYDPYLTEFVSKIFKYGLSNFRVYKSDIDCPANIWQNLLSRSNGISCFVLSKAKLAPVIKCADLPFIYGIHHTPVTHIVTIYNPDNKGNVSKPIYVGGGMDIIPTLVSFESLTSIYANVPEVETNPIPACSYQNEYVMSDAWYKNESETLSVFEIMVNEWLAGKPVDQAKLTAILDVRGSFTKLDRFYLYPILIFLLTK